MEKFLKKILKINNFKITYFDTWKNNITAKVESEIWVFVVQEESSAFSWEKNLIENSINIFNNNWLNFAWNFFNERFFNYDWKTYQVMEYINWKSLSNDQIDLDTIKNMSRYLANFHNFSKDLWKLESKETFKNIDLLLNDAKTYNLRKNDFNNIYEKIKEKRENIILNENLKKWLLHWDPAFKNFLFDDENNTISIIDYEKMEYNNLIWDLVDMIRSFLQIKWYSKKEFDETIKSYEEIRKLTFEEKIELKKYLKIMILNTCTQYFLALFEDSPYQNHKWWINDSLKKIDRCFNELEIVDFF